MRMTRPLAKTEMRLSAVVLKEGEWYSAQCLEYDIATQAKTLPDLYLEFQRVLMARAMIDLENGRQPFEGLKPAPEEFFRMFFASKLRLEGDEMPFAPGIKIPHPDMRYGELRDAA